MYLMPSFASNYSCVRSIFYTQLSSVGVFGTEANTVFMRMGRSGCHSTFVKIATATRLMSDELEIALVLGNGSLNQSRSVRLALFCFFV